MIIRALAALDRLGKKFALRCRRGVHPKHLIERPWDSWYLNWLEPGKRVLDFGCGPGAHALRCAARGCFVTGVDPDAQALGIARRAAREQNVAHATCFLGPVEFLYEYWEHGPFDWILCLDVLEHVVNRTGMLREFLVYMKSAGGLFLAVPNAGTRWRERLRQAGIDGRQDADHKVEYRTWPEVVDELQRGGWRADGGPWPTVYDTPLAGLIDAVGGLHLGLYRRLLGWRRAMAEHHPSESTGWCCLARRS